MSYPSAPWSLRGYAYQTVQLIRNDQARLLIPDQFEIVSVIPNHTLGGIYLSSYINGSSLEYSELIVVSGLVSYAGKTGIWVSHIYVDNPDSVAGGREIWGLPKELAQFTWEQGQRRYCKVQQGDRLLYTFRSDWQLPLWRQPIAGQALSTLVDQVLLFDAKASANFAVVGAELHVPSTSPFASLGLTSPWLVVAAESLDLTVRAPQAIGVEGAHQTILR
ncbi:acetoacetate decarboxylase family protein [Oscillatoria sp. FACHB-1407]|uniref:acetoacetate decarboxylase family protein n=1 Tax=Oscillatoria sp. FACHB-1407 TaxID=2692847 RepID=UPI001686EEFE|nr:acetoacetate decarboxylase family protein [Oscillatoria sp. FACHB-1407]MBD2460934.1 acetoacetate decarboxylase family protein [Oscillatoria sp. FACHB-1407]